MTAPTPSSPVVLMAAIAVAGSASFGQVETALETEWGRILARSNDYALGSFTQYYAAEMGTGIQKRIVAFDGALDPDDLAQTKLRTNELESKWADDLGHRPVNIDPGYLSPHALVLASCRGAGHRIYVGDGVYAQLELRYKSGTYIPLPWTYRDFRQTLVLDLLADTRPRTLRLAGL
jgi:hypothetical protein